MGTNYYLNSIPCEKCGSCGEKKHIGKLSWGWQFHFRGYRDDRIMSFKDWLENFNDPKKEIRDEDGKKIEISDFIDLVVSSKENPLHHYNIVCNLPTNEHEKKYLSERKGYYPCDYIEKRTWKDNESFAFTGVEFC